MDPNDSRLYFPCPICRVHSGFMCRPRVVPMLDEKGEVLSEGEGEEMKAVLTLDLQEGEIHRQRPEGPAQAEPKSLDFVVE